MSLSTELLITGFIVGLTYAVLAVGLVLIYRATRVVNFAHGQLGAVPALLLAKLALDHGIGFWYVFPFAVMLGAGLGALVEVTVVGRLSRSPRVTLMVATIGLAQVLYALSFWAPLRPDAGTLVLSGYPSGLEWEFSVGDTVITGPKIMILLLVPVAVTTVAIVLTRTSIGLQIRAASANAEAARLSGISVKRVSTVVWALAGALSALTVILLAPSQGGFQTEVLGPGLMVRALAAALVGRMTDLRVAFVAGIVLGIIEQVTFANWSSGGTTEFVVFLVIMAMLFERSGALAQVSRRAEELTSAVRQGHAVPAELQRAPWYPRMRFMAMSLVTMFFVVLPVVPGLDTQSKAFLLTQVVVFAIAALSLVPVVGMSGQLAMGQYALVGVGAYVAARMSGDGYTMPFVVLVAAVIGAAASVVVGIPAARIRGLFLGISTLGFAVVSHGWLFNQSWITGGSSSAVSTERPLLPLIGTVDTAKGIYYCALALLLLVVVFVRMLNTSALRRTFVAVRENSTNASAHGFSPVATNVHAFAISGAIAAVGGVAFAYSTANFDANAFRPAQSLTVLALGVIGGVASPAGILLATMLIVGVPFVLGWSTALIFLLSGAGLLAVLIGVPGGLVTAVDRFRSAALRQVGRSMATLVVDQRDEDAHLVCRDVAVRFGGLSAIEGVSLHVDPGEIVGLIGANGAGKTTLIDCVSGYVRPTEGEIHFGRHDLSHLSPEFRPILGIARTFQGAQLYPELSVLDTVMLALDATDRPELFSAVFRPPWEALSTRSKTARAQEVLELVGLWDRRDVLIKNLPTGTRRACDLATVIAQRPRLLLLDEPTAGISTAEVQSFVPLLRRVRDELSCSVLIIEHDMDVMLTLAQRIYALEAGRVIAEGTPDEIRTDERVLASYLGASSTTDGVRSAPPGRRRQLHTSGPSRRSLTSPP